MEELCGKSMDLMEENLNSLKQLFPEVFTEGKIDFEKLRLVLGDEVDDNEERYEFTWHGKKNAIRIAQTPSTGTLIPDKEGSKNWDDTDNLYIEGDNLEVLKLMQKSYFGKVKIIYIDPPYNTGKDFVYHDDFRNNIANYKDVTNQNTKANPETNGRYHTDWLNMMYPRLKLARNLLKEDGIIFISIDDNEVENLQKIADEIFGENNFITFIVWQCLDTVKNDAKYFSNNHEYILCYGKDIEKINIQGIKKGEKQRAYYKNYDNDPRGDYLLTPLHAKSGNKNSIYTYTFSNGQIWSPPKGTYPRFSKETLRKLDEEHRIYLDRDGKRVPQKKTYLKDVGERMPPVTFWECSKFGSTRQSNLELSSIMGKGIFQNPKPIKTISTLIDLIKLDTEEIILDFFSGSSTTANAILKLNSEDDIKRKFIMVQLPELTDEKSEAYKAGYKNICEIGKERIRRAGDKIVSENKDKEGIENLDIGFKVFKLDSSNLKSWDSSMDNLEQNLLDMESNLKQDRTNEDLLYEILLKSGIELTAKIEEIKVGYNTLYNIGQGALLACLDDKITQDVIDEIPKHKSPFMDTKVIFKEAGFMSDAAKINAVQNLKQFKIEDVRSV